MLQQRDRMMKGQRLKVGKLLSSTTRIVDSVYETLRKEILSGKLSAGQQLSVPELARQLSVSRSPVREAVLQLVADGLAVENPRKGVAVKTIEIDDLLEIHEVREPVEGLSARLCAERIDPGGFGVLREILDRQRVCVEQSDGRGYFETNLAFHEALARFTRNNRLQEVVRSLGDQMRIGLRHVASDVHQQRRGILEHAQILKAIERHDSERAESLMRTHIAKTRDRLAKQAT
jgi:DNA-binding GntR family transcriptional regulator